MQSVIRHDTITLNGGVLDADFEAFMTQELIPYFSDRYQGPTRASIADIVGQEFCKRSGNGNGYLWVTRWQGPAGALQGASFEGTRMIKMEDTDAMLAKLATFGKRGPAGVFEELASVTVDAN
jgi:hypothetical protein